MPGLIPKEFIDQVISRADVVDVIDRRVPLTRKGAEYKACCPFHEEKTPSFTVSPAKQFYHCFGCGAHGTAIGFLMEHSNLSFPEAVEELADSVGLRMPQGKARVAAVVPGESQDELREIIAEAHRWFQAQLRAPDGRAAIAYLKARGLDGRTAAAFGIGYAPPGWDNLARALGDSDLRRRQLRRAGLLGASGASGEGGEAGGAVGDVGAAYGDAGPSAEAAPARIYDRFRGRVIFPIEDRRGRVVAFGGRILADGEPKYLNSPDTPLFRKGAEVYGLHRARRAIGSAGRAIVVEGYLDVIALAQFGLDNAVATLGTAATRTHLQRLFQLAPEIVFCFDGDRAGRDAAWKAMQTALPELRDGLRIRFLFLSEGEDPDSAVRDQGGDGFASRVAAARPLPDFLFDTLAEQVGMKRLDGKAGLDGKARLVALAKPLLDLLPQGALRKMMLDRLFARYRLSAEEIDISNAAAAPKLRRARHSARPPAHTTPVSPLALAVSLLLQHPQLAACAEPAALAGLDAPGAGILREIIEKITQDASATTARLLEHFREDQKIHAYLAQLAARDNHIAPDALRAQFGDTLACLRKQQDARRRSEKIEQFHPDLPPEAKARELREIKEMLDARFDAMRAPAEIEAE
ncbi:MAG: DNA primase [Gammaproteobacteria bacterium]